MTPEELEQPLAVTISNINGRTQDAPPFPVRITARRRAWVGYTALIPQPGIRQDGSGWIHVPSGNVYLEKEPPKSKSRIDFADGSAKLFTKAMHDYLSRKLAAALHWRTYPLESVAAALQALGEDLPPITHPDAPR